MKSCLTILLICLSITVFAQKNTTIPLDTVFLDMQKTIATSKGDIAYYRFIYHAEGVDMYKIEDYYINGEMNTSGLYKTSEYKDLWTIFSQLYRQGHYTYLYEKDFKPKVPVDDTTSDKDKPLVLSPQNYNSIYNYVEQMPEAPYDVYGFLGENTIYPDGAKEDNVDGVVNVRFVVSKTGDISHIEVVGKYPHIELAKAALISVSKFPPWKPGTQNGKPVNVYYTLPVTFRLGPQRRN